MPSFHLDKTLCKRDGICAKVCPVQIIQLDSEGWPFIIPGREQNCIACGHCIAYCPHLACRVESTAGADNLSGGMRKIKHNLLPGLEQTWELCASRRSIRCFSDKLVPLEIVRNILEATRFSPTGGNRQIHRFIHVRSPEMMHTLGDHLADFYEQSEHEIYKHVKKVAKEWRAGKDNFFRGGHELMVVAIPQGWRWDQVDGAIALSYFELLAHAAGVGCCWAGYFTTAAREYAPLRLALGLAESETISGAQIFGYSALKVNAIPPRKELRLSTL